MNEIFNFHGQEVRTLTIDDEPWFVGKDVADILGYSKARNAIALHVDEDDALKTGPHRQFRKGSRNYHHQRIWSLLPHLIQQVASSQGVQALGDIRGFASYSQAGWFHP
ncbi:gp15 [Streptococcus pneumoniae]|nr:gp15 [Streptococcus pneumoniae]